MSRLSKSIRRGVIKQRAAVTRTFRRLRRQDDGIAAVEFALLVPVMAFMTMGAIELSEAVTVDRRVSQVAATTGDLIAQVDGEMEPVDVGKRSTVGSWMIDPYALVDGGTKLMTITVTFVRAECNAGDTCVKGSTVQPSYTGLKTRWECVIKPDANGTDNAPTCRCPTNEHFTGLPAPSGVAGESLLQFDTSPSLLITKVDYSYKPKFFDMFLSKVGSKSSGYYTYRDTMYNKPRGQLLNLKYSGAVCS